MDELVKKTDVKRFQLNENKSKELRIGFLKSRDVLEPVVINDKRIEIILFCKVLGLKISADLRWNEHVKVVCGKVALGLYFLRP